MKRAINTNDPEHFYCAERPFIQRGWYNLFVVKHKIPVAVLIECLEEYRAARETKGSPWSKKFTLDVVSAHFEDLLKMLTEKTGKEFKKNPVQRQQRYQHDFMPDWENGEGVWNNSADDF